MRLCIVKGENPGRELVVDKTEYTIGREVDNDFVISEVGVSRHHCRLSQVGGEWLVEDCHSVNGILVNSQKVDGGIILRPNDEITVFSHVFRFLSDTPDGTPSAVPPRPPTKASLATARPPDTNVQTTADISKPMTDVADNGATPDATAPGKAAIAIKLAVLAAILAMAAFLGLKLFNPSPTTPPAETAAIAAPDGDAPAAQQGQTPNLLPETTVTALAPKPVTDAPEPDGPPKTPPAAIVAVVDDAPGEVTETVPRPAPRTPARTTIVVRSDPPGAEVFVNKTAYGLTPAVVPDLAPGRHLLELQLDGYEDISRQVQIPEDDTRQPFAMHLRAGTLLLTSTPPGAGVWHGRQFYGVTPLLLKNLPEGQYDLTLHGQGCEPHKVTAMVSRARGEVISADLKTTLGNVAITSRPPGCRVFLDGIFKGVTSADRGQLLLTDLAAGPATMKVEHPSGVFASGAITILKGQTLERNATLWVPTHQLTLIDGKKITGLLLEQNEHGDVVLEDRSRRAERFLKPQITAITELTNEEITQFFSEADKDKDREREKTAATAELAREDDFSMSAPELLQELKRLTIQDFNDTYKGKQILLTGMTTLRQQPKGDKTPGLLYFGQLICARLAMGTSGEEWEHISTAAKNNTPVSVRGLCDGIKDKAAILDNCTVVR